MYFCKMMRRKIALLLTCFLSPLLKWLDNGSTSKFLEWFLSHISWSSFIKFFKSLSGRIHLSKNHVGTWSPTTRKKLDKKLAVKFFTKNPQLCFKVISLRSYSTWLQHDFRSYSTWLSKTLLNRLAHLPYQLMSCNHCLLLEYSH